MADLNKQIQTGIARMAQNSRFNISPIARHIHTGLGSPTTAQPTFTYVGLISDDGTIGILPNGWTASNPSTGIFKITHNLGTLAYVVVASALGNATAAAVDLAVNKNFVNFTWLTPGTSPAPIDVSFFFQLTTIANTNISNPVYPLTDYLQTGALA